MTRATTVPGPSRSFVQLCEEGYWQDYSFNRVVKDFVIQAGCPDTPEGFAYCEHLLAPEIRLPDIKCAPCTEGAGCWHCL